MIECCDINADGHITPGDVLVVINAVNSGDRSLSRDANHDGHVTALDALKVINYLNARPEHVVRVHVRDADTVGFTETEVRQAIDAAFSEYESVADVAFEATSVASAAHVTVTTEELYEGGGVHSRGAQGGSVVYLHDGQIGAFHHSGRQGPVDQPIRFQVFANTASIQNVFGHELGHWIGMEHTENTGCRMHINAPAGFCGEEVGFIRRRFP